MKKNIFSHLELSSGGFEHCFGLFDFHSPLSCDVPKLDEETGSDASIDSYLKNGQRLLTLARQKMPVHREYTALAKKLAEIEFEECTTFAIVLSKIAKHFRGRLKNMTNVYDGDFVKQLKKLLPHIKFDLCTYEEYHDNHLSKEYNTYLAYTKPYHLVSRRGRSLEADERVIYLICPQLFGKVVFLGFQKSKESRTDGRYCLRTNRNYHIADISHVLAYMYMAGTVMSNLNKEDFKESTLYKDIITQAGRYCTGYQRYSGGQKALEPVSWRNRTVFYLCDDEDEQKDIIAYLEETCDKVAVINQSMCNLYQQEDVVAVLEKYLPDDRINSLKINSVNKSFHGTDLFGCVKKYLSTMPTLDPPIFLKSTTLVLLNILWESRRADFSQKGLDTLLHHVTVLDGGMLPGSFYGAGFGNPTSLLLQLFLNISSILRYEVKKIEQERREQADHARSFETKKNIPQKILKLMKESVLNERFGYLEYDETCDTSKIDVVNTQLLSFVETYFPNLDLKEVSLRFRRLGNHKANGLYYPAYKCIAVELSHPSSFVHEFGHMLDYTQGNLSNCYKSAAFAKLYKQYVRLLDEKLNAAEATAFYKKGGKKSKYNYYTKETEVFARSFEVYITQVLHLDNTIVRTEEDYRENPYVYHMDNKEYMEMVFEYFNSLPCMADLAAYLYETAA